MKFKRAIVLFIILLLISNSVQAEITSFSFDNSIYDWINTEEGREYANVGITTYYVGDDSKEQISNNLNSGVNNMMMYSTGTISCNITYEIIKGDNLSVDIDYIVRQGDGSIVLSDKGTVLLS